MDFIWFKKSVDGWEEAALAVKGSKAKIVALQVQKKYGDLIHGFMLNSLTRDEFLEEVSKRYGTSSPRMDNSAGWVNVVIAAKEAEKGVYPIEPNLDKVLDKVKEKVKISEKLKILKEAESWYLNRSGWFSRFLALIRFPFNLLPRFEPILRIEIAWAKFWLSLFATVVNNIPGDQKDYVAALKFMLDTIEDEMLKELLTVRKIGEPVAVVEDLFVQIKPKLRES